MTPGDGILVEQRTTLWRISLNKKGELQNAS